MLDAGLCAMVNSDDPAYFGGYLNDNFNAIITALSLSPANVLALVRNSFEASFIDANLRAQYEQNLGQAFTQWMTQYD